MSNIEDPRDPGLEVKLTLPKTWTTGGSDGFSASSMLMAGAVMVTRNRFLAWPALLFGVSAFVNQHPLRTKESTPSWQGLISGVSALILSYMPMILIVKPNIAAQVPLAAST
ncbi:hypothetical protein M0805_009461 [Coniferiporia weirii]|nr:hypothetical protein M0805_009461 [Coniferiporia weirii]